MDKSPHLNRDWLYHKYIVEHLSTYDIGKLVHRDPKRIYEKLVDFGIPTRPRGENLKGNDNFMAQPNAVNPFAGQHHTKETRLLLSKLAKRAKPWLRGANNGMFGKRGAQVPSWKGGITPERQAFYSSQEWKHAERKVGARDKGICQRCGKSCKDERDSHLHHIISFANKVMRADVNNLVTLCGSCHRFVHSKKNTCREFLH